MGVNAPNLLSAVFGADSVGDTPDERADSSRQLFVRSIAQLALDNGRGTGRRLSARESLDAFGWNVLARLADRPVTAIRQKFHTPQSGIDARLKSLGLQADQVTRQWGIPADSEKGWPSSLERLSQALALDDGQLFVTPGSGADEALGVRLRELHTGDIAKMAPSVVMGLAEAAWVIGKQAKLTKWLRESLAPLDKMFPKSGNYGSYTYPAWAVGIDLAHKARDILGIAADEPINSISDLVENKLGIPVINLQLPGRFAGATLSNNGARGIAVNLDCLQSSVWTRRMTIAHELGHLLWDPDERLNKLRVDDANEVNYTSNFYSADYAEMRANAFAAEFLAPQSSVREIFVQNGRGDEAVSAVMEHYRISFTAATYQIWNSLERKFPRENLRCLRGHHPSDECEAAEAISVDMFNPREVPVSRRGKFSVLALKAYNRGLISRDSFVSFMGVRNEQVDQVRQSVENVFPEHF